MFENLELQFLAELSSVRGVVLRCSGTAPARMNLMFWGVCVSVTAPVWILYLVITDSSLRLGIYEQKKNFHRILSSEQVSNKSATFVLTNWGKKHYNKSRYQWWLNLTIGLLISHQTKLLLLIYFILKLLMLLINPKKQTMLPSNWFSLKYKSCVIPGYL